MGWPSLKFTTLDRIYRNDVTSQSIAVLWMRAENWEIGWTESVASYHGDSHRSCAPSPSKPRGSVITHSISRCFSTRRMYLYRLQHLWNSSLSLSVGGTEKVSSVQLHYIFLTSSSGWQGTMHDLLLRSTTATLLTGFSRHPGRKWLRLIKRGSPTFFNIALRC